MCSDANQGDASRQDPLADVPVPYYDVLGHPRRIRVLAVLGSHRTPLSLQELTAAIVDREDTEPQERSRREVRLSLVHNHLPRLAEHGFVDWDRDHGAELLAELPVHPADLAGLLERRGDGDDGRLLEAIVHPVRLRIVAVVSAADRPLRVDALAAELVDRGVTAHEEPDRMRVALHHAHLPKLDDCSVLEFDADAGIVSRDDPLSRTIQ